MTQPASFRDPGGRLFRRDGRIFRQVHSTGLASLDAALGSKAVRAEIERGRFVKTEIVSRDAHGALLEHEAIPFPSFPYEWPPEMLHAAAQLTIDLALSLAEEGLGIKDATPFNVLFRGPHPVFVDLLSIEPRGPRDPLWLARAQFIRTCLLPLAAERDFTLPLSQSLFAREGIEPETFYRMLSRAGRFSPKYLSLVSMPVWMGARKPDDASIYQPRQLDDPEKAAFVYRAGLRALQKSLARFAPAARQSNWTNYMAAECSYTPGQFAEKERFVVDALREFAPKRVLDAGANTGHFSALSSRAGASVVSIDADSASAGQIWRRARAENLDVLPLVVNLAQPTPATGWRNRECSSFLERAAGAFDCVMMLAVVHHLLATERVPLAEILDLAADLTRDLALIEFVDFEDPMFRRLSRGRDHLYRHFDAALFERESSIRFELLRKLAISGSRRTLFLLRKK
ncbi:MAG TPA: class I SAM-dependent methyltransferase [Bryobacteraceae bacterium]|nr:class I SAM-dependent methyltransferase [Bryobacteraceae bacterium]